MDIIADEIRFENESATSAPPNGMKNKQNKQNKQNNNGYPRKVADKLNVGPNDDDDDDDDGGGGGGGHSATDGSIMELPGNAKRGERKN